MKKETIFRHELNESIQADAAMTCLKNRNKPQQMNEAVPVVAGLVRLAMPLLRPIITKLVRGMIVKAGAKLTGRQVAKMVIKNVSNGKTLMKIGKKVGQTWTELPSELKDEITKTAINTFNELRTKKSEPQIATQEQEEETSAFDERFAYRKDLRDMANDVTKKAYMIIRKEYGDSMWRRLHMDDCDERGLISQMNDYQKYYNITNPQDIADCMLGRKSVRSFKKSREEQEEVKNYRDKLSGQYEEYVLPDIVDMVSDKGISEEEVKARLLKSPKLPWEYDEIEEWVAKNFPEEQEEVKLSESEIEELTFKLADYLLESFIILEDEDEDYSNLLEAVEKILRKDAPKSDTVAGYYAWCRKWFMKIEDLTYSYYNEPNPESYYSDEDEETDDYDKDEVAMQLVKKSKKTLKTSWAEAPEMFILQKVRIMLGGAPRWWRTGLVDWVKAICNACDAVLGKANDREIKTLITWALRWHYLQQDVRKLYKSASYVIEKTGDKPASFNEDDVDDWIRKHDNDFRRVLFASQEQEEMPQMERHDMILALSEYMAESWIASDDEDGDLDDIYYAVADILDKTGDYPASTSWEDCKPWCQKHYKEVESRVITEEDEEWSVSSFEIYVDDIYETLMEIGDGEILDEVSSKRVKSIIGKILKKTNNFPHDDNELARWVRKWNKKIVEILERR